MTVAWMVLIVAGALGSLAAFIWLLKIAFRESTAWGLACLFIPFAALIFVVKFWDLAKLPFFGCLVGSALGIFAAVGYSMTSVNIGIEEYTNLGESVAWEAPNVESFPSTESEDQFDVHEEDSMPDQTGEVVDEVLEGAAELMTLVHQDEQKFLEEPNDPPPQPRPHRDGKLVPLSMLGSLQGERVVLILKSLERVSAYVVNVESDTVKLRHRVGGGSVTYTVEFDAIKEVRSRRVP